MIKKYISFLFISLLMTALSGCYEEKEWSEDYDIDYPISTITSVSPMEQTVGGLVTITGENLDIVLTVNIGAVICEIVSQTSTQIVFKVPAAADKDRVSVTNKYDRQFIYKEGFFIPVEP
jgi:hypothetical protein